MKKLNIIGCLLLIILSGFVSAEVNNFAPIKIGECVTIKQVCASCTYVNLSISYPNSTLAIINNGMTDIGGGTWTYEFCNTTQTGRYDITGSGDLSGTDTSFSVLYFEATPTGIEYNSAKSSTYTIVLLISLLILITLFIAGYKLPSKNKSNEMTGYIISVSNLKYIKHLLFAFSYVTLIWISYLVWMISFAFLDFDFLTNIFKILFYTLSITTLPLFILYVYITIANFIRDSQVKDALLRGLRIDGK